MYLMHASCVYILDTPHTGYAMRYLKPEITSKWRFTLKDEPSCSKYGQNPVAATTL